MGTFALLMAAGLLMGIVASPHCLAMCGGLASALDRLAPPDAPLRGPKLHLLYFAGRAGSYALIGFLVGEFGLVVADSIGVAGRTTRIGVGLMLLLAAAAIARLAPMRSFERIGHRAWQALRPVSRRVSALPPTLRALALGALWGWLPCGMVYAAAASAALAGSGGSGALFMSGFALGTLPAVALVGMGASRVSARLESRGLRQATAVVLAVGGVWTLLAGTAMDPLDHALHVGDAAPAAPTEQHAAHHELAPHS